METAFEVNGKQSLPVMREYQQIANGLIGTVWGGH